MRNLKRALSLTLASVMLLGMMVVGSSAASYPDVDDNDNVEAIEVLQAVQVMRGDDKGNFNPDSPVTRAEMAVVMALLLDLDYQYYEASCPFNDVAAWARPYVGACYANGIVSGYSAATYGSNDGVTPVQAASMMMRALGYFKYASDYADGFETATVRQGTRIGIFNDVGSSANVAMTRNQVAQMALNALECTMVDAEQSIPNISVGSGDTAVNIEGRVNYVVRTSSDAKVAAAISAAETEGTGTNGVSGYTIELGEQLYNGDLRKESFENGNGIYDVFGSPAVRWTYKNTEIGTYADEADATYTAEVKSKDIYKDLGLSGTVDTYLVIIEDGVTYTAPDEDHNVTEIARNSDKKLGGNGTLVKAYKCVAIDRSGASHDAVIISVVNTYLAQVDGAYNSDEGELDLDVLSTNAPSVESTLEDEDFGGLNNFSDAEYVLVTVGATDATDSSTQEIMTIASAEVMTGEVDKYTKGENVTVDGTSYKYNKGSFYNNDDGAALADIEYEVGKESKFVLDSYGYIIGLDEVNGANSYVYIDEFAAEGKYNRNETFYADAYFTDGTVEDITLNKIDNKEVTGFDDDADKGTTIKIEGGTANAGWYKYTTTNKGEYNLTSITAGDKAGGSAITSTNTKVVENGETKVIYDTAGSFLRGNNSTSFIIRDGKDVYAYTGIKEVGTVTTKASATPDTVVSAVKDGNYASYVFVDVGNGELKGASKASGDAIFILSTTYQTNKDRDGEYYTYDAILNGRKIAKDASNAVRTDDTAIFGEVGLYTEVYYDDNGMVTDADLVATTLTDDDYGVKKDLDGVSITQKGQTLIFGDSADSVYLDGFIRLIEGTDVTNVTANNLARRFNNSNFTGNVWATFKDGNATGVYVEVLDEVGGGEIPVSVATEVNAALEDAGVEMSAPEQTNGEDAIQLQLTGMNEGDVAKVGYNTGAAARVGTEYVLSTKANAQSKATVTIPAVGAVSEVNIVSFEIATVYDVTGITTETAVAGTSNENTFTVAANPTYGERGTTITLTATLAKAVPAGKKVTVTFTTPADKTIEIAAGETKGKVTFSLASANVEVAANAAEDAAEGGSDPAEATAATYVVDNPAEASTAPGAEDLVTVTIGGKAYDVAKDGNDSVTSQIAAWVAAFNADEKKPTDWTAAAGTEANVGKVVLTYGGGDNITEAPTDFPVAGDFDATDAVTITTAKLSDASTTYKSSKLSVTIGGKALEIDATETELADQIAAWIEAFNGANSSDATAAAGTGDNTGKVVFTAATKGSSVKENLFTSTLGLSGGAFTAGTDAEGEGA